MKRVHFLIMARVLITFLILHPVALFAQGSWKIVREADFEATYSDVDFVDKNNGWVVGRFYDEEQQKVKGLIIHTSNGGETWEYQESGTEERLYAVDFVDSLYGWAVGYNGTILHTKDGGKNWVPQDLGASYEARGVCFYDTLKGWVVGFTENRLSYTEDGGETWTFQRVEGGGIFHDVFFVDSLSGWAVGGSIAHTSDGGRNWTIQYYEAFKGFFDCSFINSIVGWAVGFHGNMVHTIDGGENWIVKELKSGYDLEGICFVDSLRGWIVGYTAAGPLILCTSDGGKNWNLQESGMRRGWLASVCFIDSCTGWAVGDGGMGGYGTVLKYSSTTSVKDSNFNKNLNPEGFKLFQNYPNPFNLETTIRYYLPVSSRVSISIYNLKGQLVKTLLSREMKSKGNHSVCWNGKDQHGKTVSSGVYLCKLETERNQLVKKLVVLK